MARSDRRPGVRPRVTVTRRLDDAARAGFPACVTILLMLLTRAPLGIDGQQAALPAVATCGVWFWSLARPDHLPPPVVFPLGLLLDLLGYLPPGVGVLALLCVQAGALALRGFLAPRGFAWDWLVFAPVACGASLLMWLLVMLLTVRPSSPAPALFQASLTFAAYPLLAVPLAAARRALASPDDGPA